MTLAQAVLEILVSHVSISLQCVKICLMGTMLKIEKNKKETHKNTSKKGNDCAITNPPHQKTRGPLVL